MFKVTQLFQWLSPLTQRPHKVMAKLPGKSTQEQSLGHVWDFKHGFAASRAGT